MYQGLADFYKSDEWENFRRIVIAERTKEDGYVYDEETGRPIVKRYDIILHHIKELNEDNVHDFNIALNPANIKIVSHKTHNIIHQRFSRQHAHVYIVYGSPMSGKTTWVKSVMMRGDLVVDMDSIWQCVSFQKRYDKPDNIRSAVFKIHRDILDCVKYKIGNWYNAYIIGGYPLSAERERMVKTYGAELIYIEASKEECLSRLASTDDGLDDGRTKEYIERWWELYSPL